MPVEMMTKDEDVKKNREDLFRLFWKVVHHILIIGLIIGLFFGMYSFAYHAFSNEAYDADSTRKVQVVISKGDGTGQVADQLYEKHLIVGRNRFKVRKFFSKYSDTEFVPGTYRLSQSQGIDEIMAVLCGDAREKDTK